MLNKISKETYNDSVFYSDVQCFNWNDITDYTSSSYGKSKMDLIKELSNKYKKYLCTKHNSESSEDEDPLMQQIDDYLQQLPDRVRRLITIKILHPEYTSTILAVKLKCHRDSVYECYKLIAQKYPDLLYFTCHYKRRNICK